MFHTFVLFCLCCCRLVGVFGVELKSVSVMEGESVTLQSGVNELQTDDEILWRFGTNGPLIAKTNGVTSEILDALDGRFGGRLELDKKTGTLTITNIRTEHSGVYEVEISTSSSETKHRFTVAVYARLPIPVISSNSLNCSSSGSSVSKCVLLCSVLNVGHVTLSWYKAHRLLSSISVSDLSISLSLPLEIECLDGSYSCVVAYSFSNRTSHLNNTELCQACPDCACCCHVSEVVIRLVISALVGVAAACIVMYDITSRKVD